LINLSSSFDQSSFEAFIRDFLPDYVADKRAVPKQSDFFPNVTYLGESEKLRTSVLVVETTLGINSRISLTKASFKILKNFNIYRALIVYLNPDQTIWRLSLLTAQPMLMDGKLIQSYSNPERHSYVLGSDVGVATARKFLLNMGSVSDFEDLKYRFSIEAINKEFYNDISKHFYGLIGRYDESGKLVQKPMLLLPKGASHVENQEYAIRLFGRIVFCWFLKEKQSAQKVPLLPTSVFDDAILNGTNILQNVLEPLFFECLNKNLSDRKEKYKSGDYELVPYLNGGLFHPNEGAGGDYFSEGVRSSVEIPDQWFLGLLETLKTYNFTLDENIDFDVELSIDPEMLGRIFENLLAEINPETGESARKTTGSFYTPRRIVSHMTDLCLTRYLLDETDVSEEQVKALMTIDSLDDLEYPLNAAEKSQIVEKLYSLKTIDPACGSGAFPIGMLQKIVFLLEQIDADFELSKKKLGKNFISNNKHLAENKNYLRKLVLIRDVIHGVDIQPVAVEISKLRCFLTLIVEQEVLDDLPNRGLEPLPNLDFQFVCADTLMGLDEQKQLMFGEDSHLEEELALIREEYYSTNSSKRRETLKQKYSNVVNEELTLFGESSRTSQLKSFQPFTVNNQALFFDSKTMFGIEDFHIVIGNPPYVGVAYLSDDVVLRLREKYFESRGGKLRPWADDLYVHFIFKAFELVKPKGLISFITNDSFIGLEGKERVREKFLNENLLELIRCPKETFGATIYTAIFLVSHMKSNVDTYTASSFSYPEFELKDVNKVRKEYVRSLPNNRFTFQEDSLISKFSDMEKLGKFLRVVDAGIDSGNVRPKMFFKEQNINANKKIIQGRQIERWAVWWDCPNAKYKYCDPTYVPQDVLGTGRGGDKPSKSKEYWNYRRGGDEKFHYLPERILMRQTADNVLAAYQNLEEDGQFYTDHTLFTVVLREDVGSLKYFLALMNSKLLNYIYKYLSMQEGKILAQVRTALVEELPIIYDKRLETKVIILVDEIIARRRNAHGCDVSDLENALDELVFEIYGLSDKDKSLQTTKRPMNQLRRQLFQPDELNGECTHQKLARRKHYPRSDE
jgi:type I restriction-modification system DNA methylase subunit